MRKRGTEPLMLRPSDNEDVLEAAVSNRLEGKSR